MTGGSNLTARGVPHLPAGLRGEPAGTCVGQITGDFNRWITRFEDQMETCETIGVELSEEAKILYFMNNLNDSIFGDVKSNFMDLSTCALFPQTY